MDCNVPMKGARARATFGATMRVLLTGATGFVGGAILRALLDQNHQVIALCRHAASRPARAGVQYREFDFMRPVEPARVVELVEDVDVLINAVGIIREARGLSFARVHVETPLALFAAAQTVQLKRIVQVSAAGTSEESPFAYFRSKAKADDYLLSKCAVPSLVLRPSLIYGEEGEATQLFQRLSALPVVPLPAGGEFSFRPILVQDVAQLVLQGVQATPMPRGVVEVGGADELTLKALLLALRAARSPATSSKARTFSIPQALMRPAAWLGDWTGAGPLTTEMLEMLVTSRAPDLTTMHRLFSFRPRGLLSHLERKAT
jgi:uncharacterized protein YbjT (DUF2867 family)